MGEEKRRRRAGAYPTEGGDPGYEQRQTAQVDAEDR
jgi:hypothetical protein